MYTPLNPTNRRRFSRFFAAQIKNALPGSLDLGLGSADSSDRYTLYNLVWIDPARNAEFCHYYDEKPGDLPNFYVRIDTDHSRDNLVEDLETIDDLVDWLEEKQEAKRRSDD